MALQVSLVNKTHTNTVWGYVTGRDSKGKQFLLQADGHTVYAPDPNIAIGSLPAVAIDIPLGQGASGTGIAIPPDTSGGRIYFSIDKKLIFKINPGPVVQEPSVVNGSDPNNDTQWDFCEFTFDKDGLTVDITYADFIALPVGIRVDDNSGGKSEILGLKPGAIGNMKEFLRGRQHDWQYTVSTGHDIRILSPQSIIQYGYFKDYWLPYINRVWQKYNADSKNPANPPEQLKVDLASGTIKGDVKGDFFQFYSDDGKEVVAKFAKPASNDIWSCSTGPFVSTNDSSPHDKILAALAAAFNRTNLMNNDQIPGKVEGFYNDTPTNVYSQAVHQNLQDGKGYAFPYDDSTEPGQPDQSSTLKIPSPKLLTITLSDP